MSTGYYCNIEHPDNSKDWMPFHLVNKDGRISYFSGDDWIPYSGNLRLEVIENMGYRMICIYKDENEFREDLRKFEIIKELER